MVCGVADSVVLTLKMIAPGAEGAVWAVGLSGPADRPAVENQPVAEIVGFLRGQAGPELLLRLAGVLGAVGEAQKARDPHAVGVGYHHAGGVMDVPQDQVGGLPAYSRQGEELLHGAGDFAVKFFQKHPGGKDDVLGLGPEEAAGVDVRLDVRRLRPGQGLQGGVVGEEGGGHLIHPLVGTLGGEPGGKEQLIVFLILQGADPVGV